MARRHLGGTGIEVSEIGVGTWELSGDVWGEKNDDTSLAAIRGGLDAGANLIDTAADYGQGHVEELVGRLLTEHGIDREHLVISTKVRPECMEFAPSPERPIEEFFRPAWIRSECEGSLRRLATDHVDVLFLHTWNRAWGHESAWFEEMSRLKNEGKIRAIGISVPDLDVGAANVPIARGQVDVVQCVYSVFQQEPEYTLFPLAQEFGIGVMARSPFSSGALVQHWTPETKFADGDWRASWPQESDPNWLENQARMSGVVKEIVGGSGLTTPEFCIKYVLGSDVVSAVIPGSANPDHVRANVSISSIPALDDAFRQQVKDLWLKREIHGTYAGSD